MSIALHFPDIPLLLKVFKVLRLSNLEDKKRLPTASQKWSKTKRVLHINLHEITLALNESASAPRLLKRTYGEL